MPVIQKNFLTVIDLEHLVNILIGQNLHLMGNVKLVTTNKKMKANV